MWYGVEITYVDGKFFDGYCGGICYAEHNEEPMNSCKHLCNNRIEIHVDWFETQELAQKFLDGEITYIHHYESYYKASIKSTLRHFVKREIVDVNEEKGYFKHKGVYQDHPLDFKPYWVR